MKVWGLVGREGGGKRGKEGGGGGGIELDSTTDLCVRVCIFSRGR